MFTTFSTTAGQHVPAGLIVVSIFLLFVTLLCYIFRFSKVTFSTFFFVIMTAISGLIDGACSLSYNINANFDNVNVLLPAVFFGLVFGAFTWMAGITMFSVFFKEKNKIFIYFGYLVTLIEIVLSIVATVFYSKLLYVRSYTDLYSKVYTADIALGWVYFLLFIALFIQTKASISGFDNTVVIVFLVLNTIRMIATFAFLAPWKPIVYYESFAFLSFFFTYFPSVVSLLFVVIYWRKAKSSNDQINDN